MPSMTIQQQQQQEYQPFTLELEKEIEGFLLDDDFFKFQTAQEQFAVPQVSMQQLKDIQTPLFLPTITFPNWEPKLDIMAPVTPLKPFQQQQPMFEQPKLPASELNMVTGICSSGVKPTKIPQIPRYKCLSEITGSSLYLRYWKKYMIGYPASFSIGAKYNIEFQDSIVSISLPDELTSQFELKVHSNVKQKKLANPFEIQISQKQKIGAITPCRLYLHHENGQIYEMHFVLTKKRTYLQKAEFCCQQQLSVLDPLKNSLQANPLLHPEQYELAKQVVRLKRTNRGKKA